MPRVIHFEINAENEERASDFYSDVFGWVITQKENDQSGYRLVYTGKQDEKGINGGLKKGKPPLKGIIPTIGVSSVRETIEKVVQNGGKIVQDQILLPKTGYLAYCSDTEGNVFALLQYDPSVSE